MNDENRFIVGIDLGNSTSTVSYFDFNQKDLAVVDISGGYGKFSVPTVVSYNLDTKDWVFGEYAILNKGFSNEIIIENLIENIENNELYIYKEEKISILLALSKFIQFLLDSIKNINPNASIEGIVVSFSSVIDEKYIKDVFKLANIENLLLKISNDKECILKSYFYKSNILGNKIIVIDYGNREIRASIYKLEEGKIICLKTQVNKNISQQKIFNKAKKLIVKKFLEETGKNDLTKYEEDNLNSFVYQQFDIIFQRQILSDIKLYYNFFYPPFQKTISKQEIFKIISFFENEINIFFMSLFDGLNVNKDEIKNVILAGGGMEIDFIHRFIKSKFSLQADFKGKSKRFISDGACIIACQELGVLPKDTIYIEDWENIKYNIGIFIKDNKFENLVYKNSFIWQDFNKKIFLLDRNKKFNIDVAIEENNKFKKIYTINIDLDKEDYFKDRNIKTIRLLIYIQFKSIKEIIFNVEDFGFGDIYPKTDFKKQFNIVLD